MSVVFSVAAVVVAFVSAAVTLRALAGIRESARRIDESHRRIEVALQALKDVRVRAGRAS